MEKNLKFNSAICTSRVQSERLLALGLKEETADMLLSEFDDGSWRPVTFFIEEPDDSDASLYPEFETIDIPAWSLHRLIEMMPEEICDGLLCIYKDSIRYEEMIMDRLETDFEVMGENMYENAISCIEWLIKEGYFNKEYLV